MDTLAIINFIKPYQRGNMFKGVFPCDALPQNFDLPACFVINLSMHNEPGSHWVVAYIATNGEGYYFDSFGFDIKNYFIRSFFKLHSKSINVNRRQLQHITSTKCGQFCCTFIICLLKNNSIDQFSNRFGMNLFVNDLIIDNMFKYLKK